MPWRQPAQRGSLQLAAWPCEREHLPWSGCLALLLQAGFLPQPIAWGQWQTCQVHSLLGPSWGARKRSHGQMQRQSPSSLPFWLRSAITLSGVALLSRVALLSSVTTW